jgi:nucleoside phosphorylase
VAAVLLVAATERELVGVEGLDQVCCGIGPVEAGLGTAHALARRRHDVVLHVGIAGATSLAPGTIVVGTESVASAAARCARSRRWRGSAC